LVILYVGELTIIEIVLLNMDIIPEEIELEEA
jgi:hypothetical protein